MQDCDNGGGGKAEYLAKHNLQTKERPSAAAYDSRKPLYQAVSASLLTGNRAKVAYLHCIKLGTNIDPACGSGNFLTETYLSLRRMENEVLELLSRGQIGLEGVGLTKPIMVSISQFHGIEINDFAVTVAKTALWIAESQMIKETEDIIHMSLDFLPLKTNANITEGNALRVDWESVVPKYELNYIMGNPPFVGARWMKDTQKDDLNNIFAGWKNAGNLDYVSCWYKKAVDLMQGNTIRTALVSTNSITQGEAVANLWKTLFETGVHIDFAHRTFRWIAKLKLRRMFIALLLVLVLHRTKHQNC